MQLLFLVLVLLAVNTLAFRTFPAPSRAFGLHLSHGHHQDTIKREWTFKWNGDDKADASVQQTLVLFNTVLHRVPGLKHIEKVVDKETNDIKVILEVNEKDFSSWEAKNFTPEDQFVAAVKAIPGISAVEAVTVKPVPPAPVEAPQTA
eukprot:gene3044-3322_t